MIQTPAGDQGLTGAEAAARLAQFGPNDLPAAKPVRWWTRVARQLSSPIIYILLFALAFDAALWLIEGSTGWPVESLAILLILGFNTGMGVWQEYRAEDALARLRAMAAPQAWVRRDGQLVHIPAVELVPGDLLRVEAGDRIPADGTLTNGHSVLVDESMLTGESVPVDRSTGEELFSGTVCVRGQGWLVVTNTGTASARGRIAGMLEAVGTEGTPLEKRLSRFGNQIVRWVAALAVMLLVTGIAIEGLSEIDEALLFAVALAVAAVPEGLPAVLTLTLALGTERMAERRAVVRRLAAVEALGSVTVVATDKTGTLTENTMHVQSLDSPNRSEALRAMILAADAEPDGASGDPIELGLYRHAREQGIDLVALRARWQRISETPFSSASKYMRVTVRDESGVVQSYLKGAPEVLLMRSGLSPEAQAQWSERIEAAAAAGNRMLAFARTAGESETDVEWLGVAALRDPPRPEVRSAIDSTRRAGIRVLMVTGDHPATARAIARDVGIAEGGVVTGSELASLSPEQLAERVRDTSVFARVTPEHKLILVETLQKAGEVVAMTGDGVNDAPALKRADVGIAMGQRGSDVAREVADLVLLDDNFATIVAAIEEGRSIYANIRKFIRFLFSTNVALVALVAAGVMAAAIMQLRDETSGLLVPLLAVQLLWINVLADGPPALALGLDRNPGVMKLRPREPSASLLAAPDIRFILGTGALKAALGLGLFLTLPALAFPGSVIQSAVFLYESLAQLAFVYPARRLTGPPVPNRVLDAVFACSILLSIFAFAFAPLRQLLGLTLLPREVLLMVGAALAITAIGAQMWSRLAMAVREQAP